MGWENPAPLADIRQRWDPLAALLPPHITLVFPFDCPLAPDALAACVRQAVAGVGPFRVALDGVERTNDGYVLLRVTTGARAVRRLWGRLYASLPGAAVDRARPYVPHCTVGRDTDPERLRAAADDARRLPMPIRGTVARVRCVELASDGSRPERFACALEPGSFGVDGPDPEP